MNIAVLSDIHGNYRALRAVMDDMETVGVDDVIVLGDILFPGEGPQDCFDALKLLKPLAWVRGNTDDWLNEIGEDFVPSNDIEKRVFNDYKRCRLLMTDETAAAVAALPEKQTIEIAGKKLLCVHGDDEHINWPIGIMRTQEDIQSIAARMDVDILLCGHTHSPYVATLDGKLIINAGSVGKPQDAPGPCWCLLRFGDTFEYGFRKLAAVLE